MNLNQFPETMDFSNHTYLQQNDKVVNLSKNIAPCATTKTETATQNKKSKQTSPTLDLSRDRLIAKLETLPNKMKFGGNRQRFRDLKNTRMQLQSGSKFSFPSFESIFSLIPKEYKEGDTLDNIEIALLLFYDLYKVKTLDNIVVAVYHFIKHMRPETNIANLYALLKKAVDLDNQSGLTDTIQDFRSNLNTWKRFQNSPLLKKTSTLLSYAAAVGIFGIRPEDYNSGKMKDLAEEYEKNRLNFCGDFMYYTLDFLFFIIEKADVIRTKGVKSIKDIFISVDEVEVWLKTSNDYITKSEYLNDPTAFKINIHEYLAGLQKNISKGDELLDFSCDMDKRTLSSIRAVVNGLRRVEAGVIARESAQALRKVPFAMCLEGHTSVGKSVFSQIIHYAYAKWFDMPVTGTERFVVNPTSNFWDGFTSCVWSVLIDDAAMFNPKLNYIDESIMDMIRILNNIPFMPDMAAIENKGRTPFKADLVVITTNTPELRFAEYFNYPLAAARRIPFHVLLEPRHVKEEIMMDVNKIDHSAFADNWYITVKRPVLKHKGVHDISDCKSQQFKLEVIPNLERIGLAEFLSFLYDETAKHNFQQNRVINLPGKLHTVSFTECCHLPSRYCTCVTLEAGEEALPTYQLFTNQFPIIWAVLLWYFYYYLYLVLIYLGYKGIHSFDDWVVHKYMTNRVFANSLLRKIRGGIKKHYEPMKIAAQIGAVLWIIYLLRQIYTFFMKGQQSVDLQGNTMSTWGEPPVGKGELESSWVKIDTGATTFDVSRRSLSMKGISMDNCLKKLVKNCAYLRAYSKEKQAWQFCRITCLKGVVYLATNHSIPDEPEVQCQIIKGESNNKFSESHYFILTPEDVKRNEDKDLAFLTIRSMPLKGDITDLFTSESIFKTHRGPANYLNIDRDCKMNHLITKHTSYKSDFYNTQLDKTMGVWFSPGTTTFDGDCGSLLFSYNDLGIVILGIHQFCEKNSGAGAIAVTLADIEPYVKDQIQPSEPIMDPAIENIKPVHAHSILHSLQGGTARVFGSVAGKNYGRSKVQKSLICDPIQDFGIDMIYGRPDLSSNKPWKINVDKQMQADSNVPGSVLDYIVDQMVDEWITQLPPNFVEDLYPYDMFTVVNGKPGIRFVDAMNRSSSMGFPWNENKRNHLIDINPIGDYQDPVIFTDEIYNRVETRINTYKEGKTTSPIFRAALKDEALPFEKIAIGKIRIFMVAPVDFTIIMRSMYLSFVRLSQSNPLIFEASPGLEAQTRAWHELYEHITEFGIDNMICGDFSGFDVNMRADFMLAAFSAIHKLLKYAGYTEEQLLILKGISYDVTFPFVEYNGDLIQFFGKNPSGQALTVTINCIVNALYKRYAYYKLNPEHEVESFRSNVRLTTYGDDDFMGVNKAVPWFNHTAISQALAEIGVTYTMADKKAESIPYIHMNEVDFLKRKWRYEDCLRAYVCPLEITSIYKSLLIGTKSSAITREDHAHLIIRSANMEFFWHGKDIFEEWRCRFMSIINIWDLQIFFEGAPLETWDDLCDRYVLASFMRRKSRGLTC